MEINMNITFLLGFLQDDDNTLRPPTTEYNEE